MYLSCVTWLPNNFYTNPTKYKMQANILEYSRSIFKVGIPLTVPIDDAAPLFICRITMICIISRFEKLFCCSPTGQLEHLAFVTHATRTL